MDPEQMALVAQQLRGWKPQSPYSSSPAQRATRRGPGMSVMNRPTLQEAYANSTPFGRRVHDSARNGKVYDREWLMGQLASSGTPAPTPQGASPGGGAAAPSQSGQELPPPVQGSGSPSSSMLETTDPAVLEQIIGLGDLERQLAMAEAMRDKESPEGRSFHSRTGGEMYVAASPLEHAATAFGKFRGKRQADKIGKEQVDGRMKILDILRNQ